MALGEKLNREGQGIARWRAALGAALLVLAAHAFVASATHFHAPSVRAEGAAQAAFKGQDDGERGAPQSGDPRCFLCRLQRDFVSDLQQSAPALAPPAPPTLEHELTHQTPALAARTLLRPGRAPPLA